MLPLVEYSDIIVQGILYVWWLHAFLLFWPTPPAKDDKKLLVFKSKVTVGMLFSQFLCSSKSHEVIPLLPLSNDKEILPGNTWRICMPERVVHKRPARSLPSVKPQIWAHSSHSFSRMHVDLAAQVIVVTCWMELYPYSIWVPCVSQKAAQLGWLCSTMWNRCLGWLEWLGWLCNAMQFHKPSIWTQVGRQPPGKDRKSGPH